MSSALYDLVERHDSRLDSKAFMCFDLVNFLHDDETVIDFDTYFEKFQAAKSGHCPYSSVCRRYRASVAKYGKKFVQLNLF